MFIEHILLWGAILFLIFRSRRARIDLDQHKHELSFLRGNIESLAKTRRKPQALVDNNAPASAAAHSDTAPTPPISISAPAAMPVPHRVVVHKPAAPEVTKTVGRIERLFMENWTGILGAVVVVAGVTFLGIYAALHLTPFHRFLMTLAAAGALLWVSHILAHRQGWLEYSAWLRSAGAAILLFACAASGGLPGLGLQWIHAPMPGLALLVAGVTINLYLAYTVGRQLFATLHVLLSMLPLAIVPASTISLVIASAVCLFAVTFGARPRWDRHLAWVVGGYLLYHLVWYTGMGAHLQVDVTRLAAAFATVPVLFGALLAHHRKSYASKDENALQLAVHLAAWGLLAVALFAYVPYSLWRGGILLALGAGAYGLGQRARSLNLSWLQRADTLSAQAAVLLALVSGYDLGASVPLLLLVAFAETLAFRKLIPRGIDAILDSVANALPAVAGLLLLISGMMQFYDRTLTVDERSLVLLSGAILAVLGQRVLRTPCEAPPADFQQLMSGFGGSKPLVGVELGWLSGVLILAALYAIHSLAWMEAASLAAVGVLLCAMRFTRVAGLTLGALVAIAGAQMLGWLDVLPHRYLPLFDLTVRFAPLIALAALAVWIAGPGLMRLIAIAMTGLDLALGAYVYFEPVSSLIPGVAWLLLSLVALELADRLPRCESDTVLGLGYGYLTAFVAAYVLVIVQSPAYVGSIRVRFLIELFALGVFAYWWFFKPRPELAAHRSWLVLHPAFLEVMLLGVAVCVVVEIDRQWWAVAWTIIALALLTPHGERLLDARARAYSLLFYWISVADVAAFLSVMQVPSSEWYTKPQATSLYAIALQVLYVTFAHKRLVLGEVPMHWHWLSSLAAQIGARRNLFIYYPLFAGIGAYLYWRFDHSLLTLLWSAEAFVVFVLSAWLRENQFRYVALAGLGGCLVRLVAIDMAQTNLGLRGLVFIGVGLLMLGMNAIYNRFRVRFES